MGKHSCFLLSASRIIIVTFAVLILVGSFVLAWSSLATRSASATANVPLPGCRKAGGCLTPTPTMKPAPPTPTMKPAPPTPTMQPGATPVTPTPTTTPGTKSCSQAPLEENCSSKDPMAEGCIASDLYGMYGAASLSIRENGNVVGRVDERYSSNCQSWWGRVFVYPGHGVDLYWTAPIQVSKDKGPFVTSVAGQYKGHDYHEAYTTMLFALTTPPENWVIRVWIQADNGMLISQDLPANEIKMNQ